MLSNILLASVAAAGLASAASVCDSTVNIVNQADITSISSCSTITGDVNINADSTLTTANIASVQSITGALNIGGTGLQGISMPLLNSIGGAFNMTGLTVLSSCSFASLKSVGSIYWQTLPALSQLSFDQTVTKASNVYISDTNLQSLSGINLMTVGLFDINNNRYLVDVTVQLANVTNALSIEYNGKSVQASFPNLIWANNATFRDCGSVTMPSLQSVNGSLGFINNTITDFDASNLTTVGQAVAFVSNSALTNVSMPKLTSVGGTLQLANNTEFKDIDGFPVLKTVVGAIDFSGNFTNATLPDISDVRGGFNFQTSAVFDCTAFNKLKSSVVKGNSFICAGAVVSPSSAGSGTVTTTSGAATTSHKSAASTPMAPIQGLFGVALTVLGAMGVGALML